MEAVDLVLGADKGRGILYIGRPRQRLEVVRRRRLRQAFHLNVAQHMEREARLEHIRRRTARTPFVALLGNGEERPALGLLDLSGDSRHHIDGTIVVYPFAGTEADERSRRHVAQDRPIGARKVDAHVNEPLALRDRRDGFRAPVVVDHGLGKVFRRQDASGRAFDDTRRAPRPHWTSRILAHAKVDAVLDDPAGRRLPRTVRLDRLARTVGIVHLQGCPHARYALRHRLAHLVPVPHLQRQQVPPAVADFDPKLVRRALAHKCRHVERFLEDALAVGRERRQGRRRHARSADEEVAHARCGHTPDGASNGHVLCRKHDPHKVVGRFLEKRSLVRFRRRRIAPRDPFRTQRTPCGADGGSPNPFPHT